MIGKTISHYKILEKLGEGGMGVVYKAEDTKLERTVALKFLSLTSIGDEEKKRFKREAKAAASLNHPNIATIFAIDEVDDQTFIAMEYIEGKSLEELVGANGGKPMPIDKAIDYATQTAAGLQAAHEKGITHRDIKSANVMVTDKGVVKIMDFGLAKLANRSKLTQLGTTLGTAAYMSPEQAQGLKTDHRTDIWAFGVVLYEMLTGKVPFPGDYEQAVTYGILHEQPQQISKLRDDIPEELKSVINKCLQKEAKDRYQNTEDLQTDLQEITIVAGFKSAGGGAGRTVPLQKRTFLYGGITALILLTLALAGYFFFGSEQEASRERVPIAVVDFINQTNEPELDGLSGMLITALEQSRRLDVMSRTRMYDEFKQMDRPELTFVDETTGREIAKRANLSALAVATIRKFGQLYTVDFKVIDPQTGERIFSTKVEGNGQESIPGLLDQLSDKTRIDLSEQDNRVLMERRGIADITTANLEAYQHYFRGQEFIDKLDFEHAKQEFRKAIEIDSTFALAYYRLAYAMGWNAEKLANEPLQKALHYIDRIPEKERFRVRAEQARQDHGFAAAVALLTEMEKLYPQDKEMLFNIADYSFHSGDFTTAVAYFDKVLAIAPSHQRTQFHSGAALLALYTDPAFVKNDFSAALARAIRDREKQPDVPELTAAIATLYAYLGEYQKAEDEIMDYLSQATTPQAMQQGRLWLTSLLPYTGQYQRTLGLLDTSIEEAFTHGDTATAVESLLIRGVMSAAGQRNSVRSNAALDRVLVFRDRTDVPNLKEALAMFAALSNRRALALELLEGNQGLFNPPIVLSIAGQCDQAASMFETVKEIHGAPALMQLFSFYHLAECMFDEGNVINAEPYAEAALQIYNPLDFFAHGVYYPKTLFLLGKISEAKGDTEAAMQYYQQMLDLWKNADDDLPDLLEAKRRFAQLKETTAR